MQSFILSTTLTGPLSTLSLLSLSTYLPSLFSPRPLSLPSVFLSLSISRLYCSISGAPDLSR